MLPTPIPGITEECFLSESDVHDIVSAYIPENTVTSADLSTWMTKNDFTWKDISNIKEYRSLVKASLASKYTVGYVRKSKTNE
ncbi:hypothetical protein DM01DRAFT_1275337, partial [Hesseltinella vesiculosa]